MKANERLSKKEKEIELKIFCQKMNHTHSTNIIIINSRLIRYCMQIDFTATNETKLRKHNEEKKERTYKRTENISQFCSWNGWNLMNPNQWILIEPHCFYENDEINHRNTHTQNIKNDCLELKHISFSSLFYSWFFFRLFFIFDIHLHASKLDQSAETKNKKIMKNLLEIFFLKKKKTTMLCVYGIHTMDKSIFQSISDIFFYNRNRIRNSQNKA